MAPTGREKKRPSAFRSRARFPALVALVAIVTLVVLVVLLALVALMGFVAFCSMVLFGCHVVLVFRAPSH